ncbi:MAG: T9SS type A sorting domain-containing protein, partial [Bacteroidales bacterium]|nr:T9SS type A sorting domain-containing protein [Bacteroidales bacterium]
EVSGGYGVRCYPNPVSGKLTVELDGELFDGEVTLVLFDGGGRKLQEVRAGVVPVDRSLFFLEMDLYTPGVYYLRIADSAGPRISVPVVKE